MSREQLLRSRIRWLTGFIVLGLVVSGVTAIPLRAEVAWLTNLFSADPMAGEWLRRVSVGLESSANAFPFLFYGTDWLAFGHFMIAMVFIGALRDPVRNRWLFDFGLIACVLVIPYALIFGEVRGIPLWWRLIDSAFGVAGFVPLWFCRKWVSELERAQPITGLVATVDLRNLPRATAAPAIFRPPEMQLAHADKGQATSGDSSLAGGASSWTGKAVPHSSQWVAAASLSRPQ